MQSSVSIVIEPQMVTLMSLGETVQLTATVRDQNGQAVAGAVVNWQSGDEAVATVSAGGLVTAVGNGTAQITARSGNVSSAIEVKVMQSSVSIVIEPQMLTLTSLGETVQLTATVRDQNGQAVAGAVVNWQSGDETVATVSAGGLVTAVSEGVARITAESGHASAAINVKVDIKPSNLERDALVALYHSTDGPNWVNNTNWLSDAPVEEWYGVSVLNIFGAVNVTSLFLASNGLSGTLPTELKHLNRVFSLDLSGNRLSSDIPDEISQMSSLGHLNFSNNRLTGHIPSGLGQLGLTSLKLGGNELTGFIPSELGERTQLQTLHLYDNRLTGGIPAEMGNLDELRSLRLENNPQLSGKLPREITNLSQLEQLYLDRTQVCVPMGLEFATWLEAIRDARVVICLEEVTDRDILVALYQASGGENWTNNTNWLSSMPIDQWFGVSTGVDGRIEQLNLNDNNLNGSITGDLGGLDKLISLNLADNPFLTGRLPRGLIDLSLENLILNQTQICAPVDAEFQSWLTGIPNRSEVENCVDLSIKDRNVLIAFYHATGGPNWEHNETWLSKAPIRDWPGVTTDNTGRVVVIYLPDNNLVGRIPPELGLLTALKRLSLDGNRLSGSIPPELGQLTNLKQLWLFDNRLTGTIPPELGRLTNLDQLLLCDNRLTGGIPAELGQLSNMIQLEICFNQITGEIPPELGQLNRLEELLLFGNQLTGVIPSELGHLTSLRRLVLEHNHLTGAIPSDIAQLAALRQLRLSVNELSGSIDEFEFESLSELEELQLNHNKLSGSIPSGLGQLNRLRLLDLSENRISGSIPSALGQLTKLEFLSLSSNRLTGAIPSELGRLTSVKALWLNSNQLTGELPGELGNLSSLEFLNLSHNPELAGPIPPGMTRLDKDVLLSFSGTRICVPSDPEIQSWYRELSFYPGVEECDSSALVMERVYLTQAVQSFRRSAPLVEDEPSLLRVFLASEEMVSNRPAIKATLYLDEAEVHAVNFPAGPGTVPALINEGSLESSANAVIPADVIEPGLEMVVEIDPDGLLGSDSGIDMRIPESGRMAVDVRPVPPLNLILVPMLWTESSDNTVVTRAEGLTADDELFRLTRDLLPVREFHVTVDDPFLTSTEPIAGNKELLVNEIEALRVMDGGDGHYMGIFDETGREGIAIVEGFSSVSVLDGSVIAHELGHNMGLFHAPCGVDFQVDLTYPYLDGSIGSWGYDFISGKLIDPSTPDIMSYCLDSPWISDFHFRRAITYRVASEGRRVAAVSSSRSRSLLLWGGLDEFGDLALEPAFVVDASPSIPPAGGPYRLRGEDANGNVLFTMSFAINKIADSDGGDSFAFTMPVHSGWSSELARIELSGPEGIAAVTRDGDHTAALLRDQITGKVRGILRDWVEPSTGLQSARRALPESGLEITVSSGIPDSVDW